MKMIITSLFIVLLLGMHVFINSMEAKLEPTEDIPGTSNSIIGLLQAICPVNSVCVSQPITADQEELDKKLWEACSEGNLELATELFKRSAHIDYNATIFTNIEYLQNMEPINIAAYHGHYSIVDWLLQQGISARAQSILGWQPIHYATLAASAQTVELLLKQGAFINTCNWLGQQPLHIACFQCISLGSKIDDKHVTFIKFLLDNGAPVNALDKNLSRPLHYYFSALLKHGCPDRSDIYIQIIKLLVQAGADPRAESRDTITPLRMALGLVEKEYLLGRNNKWANEIYYLLLYYGQPC